MSSVFTLAWVEGILAKATQSIILYGRDPIFGLHLEESCIYYGTAGAAMHVVNSFTKEYWDPLTADRYDVAGLVQHFDNIHSFQRAMMCLDIDDTLAVRSEHGLYVRYNDPKAHLNVFCQSEPCRLVHQNNPYVG